MTRVGVLVVLAFTRQSYFLIDPESNLAHGCLTICMTGPPVPCLSIVEGYYYFLQSLTQERIHFTEEEDIL